MSNILNFKIELFNLLNNSVNYAVIRNYINLPHSQKSHDIDIIVDKQNYLDIKKDIKGLIEIHGLKIISYNKLDIESMIIVDYTNNHIEFIFLDFFFRYSIFGIETINAKEVLNSRVFNTKIYHVNLIYEFLEKFLYIKFLNKEYPEKYSHIKKEIELNHKDEVNNILSQIFGITINLDNIENYSGKDLLKNCLLKNIKTNPFSQIAFFTLFYKNYFKSKLSPNGISMSFTGPDGSGKTTILEIVENELSQIFREVKVNHFRPTVIPRIAEVFNKAGLKKEVDKDYSNPHRGAKTGRLSSLIRLFYYIFDYIYGYRKIVKPVLFRRGVVIFDRYYTDIVADSKRSRINIPYKVIMSLKFLVPNMKYNFLVYVDPDNILARKQELTKEQILDIYERLDYILENDKSYIKIDNNQDVNIAVSNILNHIFEEQHKKLIKKL
jgi:thymidylate kinase